MKGKNSIKHFLKSVTSCLLYYLKVKLREFGFKRFSIISKLKVVYCLKLIESGLCSIKTMMRSVAMATIMKGPVDQRQFCM